MATWKARKPIVSTPPQVETPTPANPVRRALVACTEAAVSLGLGLGACLHATSPPPDFTPARPAIVVSEPPPFEPGRLLQNASVELAQPAEALSALQWTHIVREPEPQPPDEGKVLFRATFRDAVVPSPYHADGAIHIIQGEEPPTYEGSVVYVVNTETPPTQSPVKPIMVSAEVPADLTQGSNSGGRVLSLLLDYTVCYDAYPGGTTMLRSGPAACTFVADEVATMAASCTFVRSGPVSCTFIFLPC